MDMLKKWSAGQHDGKWSIDYLHDSQLLTGYFHDGKIIKGLYHDVKWYGYWRNEKLPTVTFS